MAGPGFRIGRAPLASRVSEGSNIVGLGGREAIRSVAETTLMAGRPRLVSLAPLASGDRSDIRMSGV